MARPAEKSIALAAALEKGDRQVLDGRLLHVEVDHHPALGRFAEDRLKGGRQGPQRAFEIDGVGPRAQGADLDRDAGPRHGAEVIVLQSRLGRPAADFRGQDLQQIEVAALVDLGLGIADAGLAEQVDAEGHALLPQVAQHGQGGRGVGAGDEIARHGLDAIGNRLGHESLGQAARFHSQVEPRRQGHARLAEVIAEVIVDLLRRAKHGEDVDEAEQLRAEGRILHGPRHELIGPEAGREETFAMLAGSRPAAARRFPWSAAEDGRRRKAISRRGELLVCVRTMP